MTSISVIGLGKLGACMAACYALKGFPTVGVDVNPRKWGAFSAGTGHEIVPPDRLVGMGIEVVIIANPVYRAEVSEALSGLDLQPEIVVL